MGHASSETQIVLERPTTYYTIYVLCYSPICNNGQWVLFLSVILILDEMKWDMLRYRSNCRALNETVATEGEHKQALDRFRYGRWGLIEVGHRSRGEFGFSSVADSMVVPCAVVLSWRIAMIRDGPVLFQLLQFKFCQVLSFLSCSLPGRTMRPPRRE